MMVARGPRASALALGAALVLVGWTSSSCAVRNAAPPAPECLPVTGELPADADVGALAGDFVLSLAAVSGPRAGEVATGRLSLRPYASTPAPISAPSATYPLFGGTELDPSVVGAVAPGEVSSEDPAAPGVIVMRWTREDDPSAPARIVLRLGADANRDDRLRFDGASLALFPTTVSPERFAGRWESGEGGVARVSGFFCAHRVPTAGR